MAVLLINTPRRPPQGVDFRGPEVNAPPRRIDSSRCSLGRAELLKVKILEMAWCKSTYAIFHVKSESGISFDIRTAFTQTVLILIFFPKNESLCPEKKTQILSQLGQIRKQ